ncbi:sensor histidine kinase [Malonomonas rubra]|uniref:sensor histidine kinase n=1 Tax=Malonomonas rubra TaxID=57040 RepID=UPI0026F33A47|nr:ATP-binding protein [Malonomonas rubra]
MRLTVKITVAVLLGIALIFSIFSYYSIQREREQLKTSLSREARHLGESLRVMVTEIWQQRGEREALAFLQRANQVHGETLVRWVWVEKEAPEKYLPRVPIDQLDDLYDEETVALLAASAEGRDYLLTYLPLVIDGHRIGAIELSESMDEMHDYVEESLRRSAMVIGAMVISSLLLMGVLGSLWVNRPMRRLRAQAERIGTGDFSTSLNLSGGDELADLGNTIERMRAQLAEAREAEQAANQAKIEALEKLRHTERLATLGKLSAGMAHELGTPLNVISGRAKLINSANLPAEDVTRSAKIIGEQVERMTNIMRQLLSFARRGEARKQQVELNTVLRSVTPLLEPSRKEKKVEVILHEAKQPLYVSADPGQLQQVLLNLALNGIQAMNDGGRLELEACSEREVKPPETVNSTVESWYSLLIRDQGSGINTEDLAHIFDPFFTTKEVGQGTGLGLSIAYGIIEEHGGWINVESSLGKGSCFTVYLPAAEAGENQ